MSAPKISVIITCYNYATYVAQAIDSVLSQEYEAVELVVVDDASTDNSRDIIAGYGDRLKACFVSPNGGHGNAFNTGYAASTGDVVMFLDADDFLRPGTLSYVAKDFDPRETMRQYRMDLVDADSTPYDVHPKWEQPFMTEAAKATVLQAGSFPTTVTSGLVFSRAFLEQVMPMPPEDFRQGADGYLATLAPLYGPLGDGGSHINAAYRQHGANHSGFDKAIAKRAAWCLGHNAARFKALHDHAGRLGLTVNEPLGAEDPAHLEQVMASWLADGARPADQTGSRLALARKGASLLKGQSLSKVNRIALTLWWLGLGILPRGAAFTLLGWKLVAATRPDWMQSLARRLRKA